MSQGNAINSRTKREYKVQLYTQQQGLCALCNQSMPNRMVGQANYEIHDPELPTLDHINRLRSAGDWCIDNLQLVHSKCNAARD